MLYYCAIIIINMTSPIIDFCGTSFVYVAKNRWFISVWFANAAIDNFVFYHNNYHLKITSGRYSFPRKNITYCKSFAKSAVATRAIGSGFCQVRLFLAGLFWLTFLCFIKPFVSQPLTLNCFQLLVNLYFIFGIYSSVFELLTSQLFLSSQKQTLQN